MRVGVWRCSPLASLLFLHLHPTTISLPLEPSPGPSPAQGKHIYSCLWSPPLRLACPAATHSRPLFRAQLRVGLQKHLLAKPTYKDGPSLRSACVCPGLEGEECGCPVPVF